MSQEIIYKENVKINRQEIADRAYILQSKPRRLMFVLTGKCNLSCVMCDRKDKNFTLPKNIVDQATGFFPYLDSIMWQGGEVFLVDYFKEIFQEATRYPQLVQEINTNGLMLGKEWIGMLEKANTRLILSIDSVYKDTYERIRKGADFEALIENINLINGITVGFAGARLEKGVNIVIMRSNYKEIEAFLDFALKYKFSGLNFLNMIGEICPEENIFQPLDQEALGYLKKIFPLVMEKARDYGITVSHELDPFLHDNKNSHEEVLPGKRCFFCLMPWISLFVDGSQKGTVYPECLCRRPVGNIFENSLDEIWNSEGMQKYRIKLARQDPENWCNSNCVKGLVNMDFLRNPKEMEAISFLINKYL